MQEYSNHVSWWKRLQMKGASEVQSLDYRFFLVSALTTKINANVTNRAAQAME